MSSLGSCFAPIPPGQPTSVDPTPYDCFVFWSCLPSKIDQASASREKRYAANMRDCCMAPTYCYNNIVYRLCFCGSTETGQNSNCHCCAICLNLPKLPCCILGCVFSCCAVCIGAAKDAMGPQDQKMEDNDLSINLLPLNSEAKRDLSEQKNIKLDEKQIAEILAQNIKSKNLAALIQYFNNGQYYNFFRTSSMLYSLRYDLIKLALEDNNSAISIEQRIDYIRKLLNNDDCIRPPENQLTFIEIAINSSYSQVIKLIDLLCKNGAVIYQGKIAVYQKLLEHLTDRNFAIAVLLQRYNETDSAEFDKFLQQNPAANEIYNQVKKYILLSSGDAEKLLSNVSEVLSTAKPISRLIAQYSGFFTYEETGPSIPVSEDKSLFTTALGI